VGYEVTNKSGDWYDQTSQNGREYLGEAFKKEREKQEEIIMTYILKFTKQGHSKST
jgi:hypothetical protein